MGLDIWFNNHQNNEKAYFRKANFIVKFFEDKDYEVENCVSIKIDKEDLISLKNRCKLVIEKPERGPDLLPTCSGFFFGSMEYDENYLEKVQNVLDWLNEEEDYDDTYLTIWY